MLFGVVCIFLYSCWAREERVGKGKNSTANVRIDS